MARSTATKSTTASSTNGEATDTIAIKIRSTKHPQDITIDRATLIRFSERAADQNLKDPQFIILSIDQEVQEQAVRFVLDWMLAQAHNLDDASVQPLPPTEFFGTCVHIHRACSALKVPRELRGEVVRDALVEYVRMAPLREDELAMITECLNFDKRIFRAAVKALREFRSEGQRRGFEGVPEWEGIVAIGQQHRIEGLE